MKKTVLVTGGAGFLGSHLCDYLIKRNHRVICVDNFYTGSQANIAHLLSNNDFEFIKHDMMKPLKVQVDEIYSLACPASPVHYQSNPIKTIKTNFLGTLNALKLAKKKNAKILLASTSEVYGDPNVHPQKEDYWGNVNPIGIRSCYDEGKRAAECLMMDYHRSKQVNVKIVRIFNTYGPRMALNDGRVVSNFIVKALNGDDITIYGSGAQTRSFCFVDDLVDGLFRMMNSRDGITGPINIGNPTERTIFELAELIIKLTKSNSSLIFEPLSEDDPSRRKPDISLAAARLRWKPKVSIDMGLKKTIPYFRQILKR